MGRAKKGPKFAAVKKIVSSKTIKKYKEEVLNPNKKDLSKQKLPRNVFVSFLFCVISLYMQFQRIL
jgi:U3 small nucleolar RNA-associated protein 24